MNGIRSGDIVFWEDVSANCTKEARSYDRWYAKLQLRSLSHPSRFHLSIYLNQKGQSVQSTASPEVFQLSRS